MSETPNQTEALIAKYTATVRASETVYHFGSKDDCECELCKAPRLSLYALRAHILELQGKP